MTEGNRPQVLTDAQWELLAPRIAACRPRHKTEPHDLRRTIEAIIWRHDHGAKWRQIPAELGPWWMAAQTFSRWSRLGAWERMLGLAQQRGGVEAGMGWRQCLQPSTAPASERTTRAQARRKRGTLGRARRAGGARSVARRLWDQGVRDRRCLRSRHRLRPRAGARALMFVVNTFWHGEAASTDNVELRGVWLLRSAGGRAAETTVSRL